MKKLTVRIEEKEYIEIKIKLLKENKSFQKYVMELIKKDMEDNK
jgi:predicted DNA binding CopG/RHH family protein